MFNKSENHKFSIRPRDCIKLNNISKITNLFKFDNFVKCTLAARIAFGIQLKVREAGDRWERGTLETR